MRRPRSLRIAVVHSFYSSDQPSGENSAVRTQVAALRRLGHDVELFGAYTDEERERRSFAVRAGLRVATGWGRTPLGALAEFDPDVVYVHNLFPNFGRRWALELPAPIVAVVHNYRPLCVNGFLYRDGRVCTLCPDGRRWSGVRHACYRDSRAASTPLAWANRRGPGEDALFEAASRIVLLSELQRDTYLGAGLSDEKVVVMPNFLPDDLDPGVRSSPAERDGWLFVGRLGTEKGVDELVRRWPAGRSLRIVGEGPLEPVLRSTAAGTDVEFLGSVTRHRVVELMQSSRAVVFCSAWYEGFPLVYIEALACGAPVLASGPSVVPDLVRSEGTGVVTELAHLEAGMAQIERHGNALSGTCRAIFEARYTEAAFAARTLRLHAALGLHP